MAKLHCTLMVVRPEGTLLPEVHLVESEVVLHEQALQNWIHFQVVEMIHCVDVTRAVIDSSLKLELKDTKLEPWSHNAIFNSYLTEAQAIVIAFTATVKVTSY